MIGSKPLSFFQPPRPPLSVSQANFAVAAAPPALMTVKSVINTQIAPTGRMKPNHRLKKGVSVSVFVTVI